MEEGELSQRDESQEESIWREEERSLFCEGDERKKEKEAVAVVPNKTLVPSTTKV